MQAVHLVVVLLPALRAGLAAAVPQPRRQLLLPEFDRLIQVSCGREGGGKRGVVQDAMKACFDAGGVKVLKSRGQGWLQRCPSPGDSCRCPSFDRLIQVKGGSEGGGKRGMVLDATKACSGIRCVEMDNGCRQALLRRWSTKR